MNIEITRAEYKLLKYIAGKTRTRSQVSKQTKESNVRVVRLLDLGFVNIDTQNKEAVYYVTDVGRAYIQDRKSDKFAYYIEKIIFSFAIPIVVAIITAMITTYFCIG